MNDTIETPKDNNDLREPPPQPDYLDDESLISHVEIQRCPICDSDFIEDENKSAGRGKLYCDYRCKTRAQTIKKAMKREGYAHDLYRYLKENPHLKYKSNGKIITPTMQAERQAQKKKHEAIAAAARNKAAQDRKETERLRLEAAKLAAQDAAVAAEERDAIKTTIKSLNLIPLTEVKEDGSLSRLSTTQLDDIRAGIGHIVSQQLIVAEKVMTGEIQWSTTQASLFKTLISKVIPDAAAAKIGDKRKKDVIDMSVEELEELIEKAEKKSVIDITPSKEESEEKE